MNDISGAGWQVMFGSCLDRLPDLADNSIDAVVTDPPYELGFMGKSWDSSGIAFNAQVWAECLRVLKPGGHLLAFSGSRTYHRMTIAIEDAGFEIRDMIAWISNKTFPKSLDISKAIDKGAGENKQRQLRFTEWMRSTGITAQQINDATEEAKKWAGWGTALKPTVEPIVMARKPLIGTVAANVLAYGTGGLNIDGSRIAYQGDYRSPTRANGSLNSGGSFGAGITETFDNVARKQLGRWPANVILDPFTADLLDEQSGDKVSRFFYCARASKRDRDEGIDEINKHPTVKPNDLMRYLVKLVTPPDGVVLDPFTGSGSTGKAAILEGFEFVGVELTEDYLPIIEGRLSHAVDTVSERGKADDEKLF